jgi:predicted SnoaL-like aldol condensation-catalyzing enzyme
MDRWMKAVVITCCIAIPLRAEAQVPVESSPDHAKLLQSADPRLAANKRFVYDFWREVLEAGHMDLAPKYLAESYIQHNPNVPSGRAAFIAFFSKLEKPKPIQPRVQAPLVAVVAEGDLVVLSFVSRHTDPKHASQKYTTTWFDMFRLENGKIAEHWDPDVKE